MRMSSLICSKKVCCNVFNTLKSHESTFTKKYSFVKKSQLAITSSNFVYQGERTTLDDRVLIAYDSKLAAVFDGRNGTKVAHKLFTDFENLLNSKLTAPINEDKIALGIKDTIHDIDQEILKDKTLGIVGSTASISYILPNLADYRKSSLITANVGNSRVVLSQSKIAVDLTVDHRPEDPEERARVEAAGGIVAIAMGEWRIMGTLNVARSIGNGMMRPYITSQPDIYVRPLNPLDEFIIVASDGVWREMSSQEAVDYVHMSLAWIDSNLSTPQKISETIALHKDRLGPDPTSMTIAQLKTFFKKDVAEFLAMEAYNQGSSDNIAVTIQWIEHNALAPPRKEDSGEMRRDY